MRSYSPIKDLTNRNEPARGEVVFKQGMQSGPFSLIPESEGSVVLGYGSKIIFGERNVGVTIEFDLSLKSISVSPGQYIGCQINFRNGVPNNYQIVSFDSSQQLIELKYNNESRWPSPKNVMYMSFLIAAIYPYNELLKNTYGDSIVHGPPYNRGGNLEGSYSALRTAFTAVRAIQTCYGFTLVPVPAW